MAGELYGKQAVVTGAARGIGLAVCELFLAEGASVILADVDLEVAQRTKRKLAESFPNRVDATGLDVRSPQSVDRCFEEWASRSGGIDILVNNAGVVSRQTWREIDYEEWKRVLDINLTGTLLCCLAAARHMQRRGEGVILNTSSVSARLPDVGLAAYCVSKAGVETLTRVLAAELAPCGIRVNAYAPGVTVTAMTEEIVAKRAEEKLAHIALRRFAAPREVAELALFLCGPRAAHITGAIVSIDGGTMIVEHPARAWNTGGA